MAGYWGMLLAVSLMRFSTFGVRMSIAPFFPELATQYGVGYGEIGTMFSVYVLGFGVTILPAGFAADRLPLVKLLVPAVLLTGVSGLVAIYTDALWVASVCRFFIGVGGAVGYLCGTRLLTVVLSPRLRGQGVSIMELGGTVGLIFTMTIAPVLVPFLPLQGLLLVPVAGCFIAGIALTRFVRVTGPAAPSAAAPKASLRSVIGVDLVIVGGLFVLGVGAIDSLFGWLATFLRDAAGLDQSQAAMVSAVLMVVQALSFYPAGLLSDRMGRMPVIITGAVGTTVGALLLWLHPSLPLLLLGAVVFGLSIPLTLPLLMVLFAEYFGPEQAGAVISIAVTSGQVVSLSLSVAAGWLLDLTGNFHLFWIGVILLLGTRIPMAMWVQRKLRERNAAAQVTAVSST